jgi:hypothetical protein
MDQIREITPPGAADQRTIEIAVLKALCAGMEGLPTLRPESSRPRAPADVSPVGEEIDRHGAADRILLPR